MRHSEMACSTSDLGQKRTWRDQIAMSALPPIADIPRRNLNVRFGPKAEVEAGLFNDPIRACEHSRRDGDSQVLGAV